MEHRVIYTRLPYDSEIEYLQSSKTQWIDTLYKMTLSDEIRTKIYHIGYDNKCVIFGSRGAVTNNFYQFYIHETLRGQVAFGQSTPETIQAHIPSYQVNGMNEIIFKDGTCICNGVSTQIPVGTENSLQNLAIFARKNQDSSVSYLMGMKLYYFQIYHNGTLVRDFIPVRKGSIGYLYDKVSKKLFSNKGTGSFILGQDVANPIPNIRRVFRFGNKRYVIPMPYDSKIEYLESSGTQWVDTGYVANANTEINAEFSLNNKNPFALYGRSDTINDSGVCFFGATDIYINHGGSRKAQSNNLQINTRYTVVHKHTSITLNSVTYMTGSGMSYPNVTFSIFRESGVPTTTNPTIYLLKGKIYFFDIFENGTLIRSFIPVRKGNVGYLYDKVSGKLFGNAGTGQFILGNDIND